MPRQFGPISRMPYFCAARSVASASDPAIMAEAGADNQRARAAAPSRLVDETGHRACRRGDHHEFGDERHFAETANGGNAVDVGITRIDEGKFALEFRLADVVQNGPADGPLPRTAADQCDRTRRKQVLQAIGRHVFAGPAGTGCVNGIRASRQACQVRILVQHASRQDDSILVRPRRLNSAAKFRPVLRCYRSPVRYASTAARYPGG